MAVPIVAASLKELTEQSLEDGYEAEIAALAAGTPGVVQPHNLRTRRIGRSVAVDLHVRVAGHMRVDEAHGLASEIERKIRARFGPATFVSIHVEPAPRPAAGPPA